MQPGCVDTDCDKNLLKSDPRAVLAPSHLITTWAEQNYPVPCLLNDIGPLCILYSTHFFSPHLLRSQFLCSHPAELILSSMEHHISCACSYVSNKIKERWY